MPTYEYECVDCGYRFDEFQKITDPPLEKCPKCGSKLRRLISGGVGVIFKGSGFYVTDYKKSNLPQTSEQKKTDLAVPEKKVTALKTTPQDSTKDKPEKKTAQE